MEINKAMRIVGNISLRFASILSVQELEALYLSIEALKVIKDGNYILPSDKKVSTFVYADTDSVKENKNDTM